MNTHESATPISKLLQAAADVIPEGTRIAVAGDPSAAGPMPWDLIPFGAGAPEAIDEEGRPHDSAEAIVALERDRASGARFLALPAPTNRWLEQLLLFADHCRQRYPVLLESELGAVFDLRPGRDEASVSRTAGQTKVLFVHIPEAAGNSLYEALEAWATPQRSLRYDEGGREDWERHLRITDDDIHRLRLISSHIDFGAFEGDPRFNEWLVITALREPVRRILSLYSYVKGSRDHPHHELIAGGGVEEYLDFLAENPFNTNSQCRMVSGSDDADRAFDTLRSRFYVAASIENLDAMLDLLSRQLDTELRIGHINESTTRIDAASLRPATLARIRRMNEQDSILYERVRAARTVGWGSGIDGVGCTRPSDGSRTSHGG